MITTNGTLGFILTVLLAVLLSASLAIATKVHTDWVLSVRNKFAGQKQSLDALKEHDSRRHLRMLAGIDLPLGGDGRPNSAGLYYAKIGIGTPLKDFYVQVDTGSDIMWVYCLHCKGCPNKNYLGMDLAQYNLKDSHTGKLVSCDQEFCLEINEGPISGCSANKSCPYTEVYGDGSSTAGYFVRDAVQYDQVSGNLQTSSANDSVIFGCGARQTGDLSSSDEALDGILGFGQSNSSMISQLASSGKVKKMFAHCLDGTNGGGIFAIGHVVQPKVNTTPLVQNQPHYNINMTAVEVGHSLLNISRDAFGTGGTIRTIVDSGTTLAYLPEVIYKPLLSKIFANQTDIKLRTVHNQYTCFQYPGSVDDIFPPVTFHFENSVSLKVYPHEYLFLFNELWCIGWQNNGLQYKDRKDIILLGDLVLSNKLVIYDLENQVIGWTEYNCSSSIEVMDEETGTVHLVGPHYISSSSACKLITQSLFVVLLLSTMLHRLFY